MINTFTTTLRRFPARFWVLIGSSFIDKLGATLVLPFFSLYITQKFGVGMTQAGILLGLFSISGFVGGMIGGALSDRFGRRKIVLFGLIASALSSLAFGLVNEFAVFYVLAVTVGLLSNVADPAFSAMVADILPEEQRAEGYGLIRVATNLAWVIGPMIGGLLISYSFLFIFIGDAVASLIVAAIFFKLIPETKPESKAGEAPERVVGSFLGYFKVAKDWLFLAFTIAMMFNLLPYMQVYGALPVFLRDVHGITESGYGYMASASGILVVLTQFWVSSKANKRNPMHMLALSAFFFMIGLGMFALVSQYALFVGAILIITIGEMLALPVAQAMTAKFAPEQMRGRYLAFFNLSWLLPQTFSPGAAGLILDNYDPRLLWIICAMISVAAIALFLILNPPVERRTGVKPSEVLSSG